MMMAFKISEVCWQPGQQSQSAVDREVLLKAGAAAGRRGTSSHGDRAGSLALKPADNSYKQADVMFAWTLV